MSWPIIDRPALRESIDSRLSGRPPRPVALVGPSGIGKTTAAAAAAARWRRRGGEVLSILGVAELTEVPLAAFVPAMGALGVDDVSNAEALERQVIAAAGRRAGELLLVVDDAPLLDATSAGIVYHLIRAFGLPAVLTQRAEHRRTGAIARLWHEDLVDQLDVTGLATEHVDALLRQRLGAVPRPDDVRRLRRQTDGNPLFLREVVERAERQGLVTRSETGVRLREVATPRGLLSTVADRVADLPPPQLHALQALALGAAAPVELLLPGAAHAEAVEDLSAAGLVTMAAGGVARLAHPLHGEAALGRLDPGARTELAQQIATRLWESGDRTFRFSSVLLRLGAGARIDPAELHWALRHAFGLGEHLTVVELAARADDLDLELPVAAAIDLASAHSALDDLDAADRCFAEAERRSSSSADAALLVSRRGAHLAYRRFDVAGALALVQRFEASLTSGDRQALTPEVRTWQVLAGAAQAGATQAVEADTDSPLGSGLGDVSPAVAVRAAMAAVMLDAMGGRDAQQAAEILIRAEREHGLLEPHAAAMVHLQRYFMLLSSGQGDAARAVAEEQLVTSAPDAAGIWTYTLGVHLMYGGRLREAGRLALLAEEQLRWRDPIGLLGAALALRAVVAAQADRIAEAEAVLGSMLPAQRDDPKAAMLLAEAQALLAAARGDVDLAAKIIEAAAGAGVEAGYDLVAAISLGICIRLGAVDRAAPLLAEIRGRVGSGLLLYRALDETARGLSDRDPVAVLTAARDLAAAGMVPAAVDALRRAEAFADRPGQGELLRRLQLTKAALAEANEAAPLLSRGADELSAREWQVADRVRRRLASREIADELGISVRTVDNHLANVYRKLGVSRRGELRALFDPDGSAAPDPR
ncbi:helix-turn-helix transcriptional regulator [Nocardioides limicola]|uniref:helix-turn-helix transcriptional regulator n=1 Tax=Nocardioides limicola TaxID=2803368 RepID=UPI00193C1BA1|nr:LuxR family transcriptional regulator [Nocardioides sp. DJM-14]